MVHAMELYYPNKHNTGEATITLQDVQIIWALPIDGEPVTGLDLDRTTIEWQDYCLTYLGFRPDATAFKGSRLQTHAIISHIAQVEITYDTPHEIVVQYARAVALLLLGGVMCPDSSGNLIPLLYLTKLEDIVEARNYSWGSAVLAFLYRELCNATNKGKAAIGGALQLLQIWAWSRIIPLCPGLGAERVYMGQVQTDNNRLLPAAPYGATWNCEHTFTRTVRTTVRVIRDILDEMQSDQFIWQPYDLDSDVIMAYAADFNPQLWRSSCPLIFYAIVEMHRPERVLRQFGMRQNIPEAIDTRDMSLHQISRKNRTGTDWNLQHIQYISRWQRRYDTVVQRPPISNRRDTERGYWEWYNNITRHFVSSSTNRRVESGYQPGNAPMLQVVTDEVHALDAICQSTHLPLTNEECRQLVDRFAHGIQIIKEALPHLSQQIATSSDNAPTTSHRQRRSSSQMSIGSVERDDVGVDLAGPSTVYTPQDYYVPQPPQDDYVPQPPQDDWFQTAPYMPSHAQVHLDLGLGINQPYAPEYNISPVPFPSFSAYRNVESSSAASSSRLHSNSGGDNNDEQNEPIDDMGVFNFFFFSSSKEQEGGVQFRCGVDVSLEGFYVEVLSERRAKNERLEASSMLYSRADPRDPFSSVRGLMDLGGLRTIVRLMRARGAPGTTCRAWALLAVSMTFCLLKASLGVPIATHVFNLCSHRGHHLIHSKIAQVQ
ncbi:UNVERIFIED_CONTAM: Serine/threonine-protein phosphatase 7 long form [Sesamum radiatum]|uniref:Serine/threonine-protein phosphatase 7 long form n=2 Tax=Sesamum radiatum TaxID=300843 RepID=A0AAW2THT7_SESRA